MDNGANMIGANLILPPLEDFTFDDVSNARLFASRYHSAFRWQADAGKWLVWENTHWKADNTGFVMLIAQAFAKSLYDLVPEIARSKEELQSGFRHATRSNNAAGIRAFLELSKSELTVNSEDLDRDHYLLNTLSGTIDLKTGECRKHDPTDYLTKLCPHRFNPDADCSTWLEFLETILPDESVRNYLRKAIGYSLTGVVRERAFFICYGFGRNGKSVFIDTISKLLGDYARNTTADSLMKKQTGSIPNDVARLKGARFVTTAETDEGRQLHESLIKSLTGGDKITARYLFNEYFDFYFEGKLWLATNHKPVIKDQSNGMWDRVKLIPFSVTIPPQQAIDKDELVSLLLGEAAGLLAWAVAGCLEWQRERRLITPEAIELEIAKYKYEQDSIAQFLEEKTEPGEYFQIENGELFEAYRDYCKQNNEYEFTHRRFSQKLVERGFTQTRQSKRYWNGLRII
ncbi:MAG: phage/plasmid primase, P4 family [bacterium]|nr:phage/plasmid primase, P4 family [bacterium]